MEEEKREISFIKYLSEIVDGLCIDFEENENENEKQEEE